MHVPSITRHRNNIPLKLELLSGFRVASLVTNAFTLWQGILQLRDILRSLAFLSDGFLAFELGIIGFLPLFELVVAFHHSSKR